jgi:hypothetical protein
MITNDQKNQEGFVAIVSAIVISTLLFVLTLAFSYSGFFARFNVIDMEFKKESVAYAESCVDIARVFIAENASYSAADDEYDLDGSTTNGNECKIVSVTGSAPYVIKAQAIYKKSTTNIHTEVTRTSTGVPISVWKEVPNF